MCFQWRVKAGGGMSDLSVYELGDNVWDEFGASDDHIVPHPAGGYCDQFGVQSGSLKKSRYDISSSDDASGSTTQRNKETGSSTFTKKDIMLEKGPWSHTPDGVFTGSCENGSVKEGRMPDECLKNDNIDALGAEFCVEDSILGKKYTAVGNNANCYPLSHITQTDNDLTFFNDDREDKDGSDLLYYGWPDDIGNFEDVDKIFRSCDSTFGLESLGKEDDFCWFTSSHSAEGCDDMSKLGSKFSTSEACELTDASGLNSLGPSVNDSNKLSSFTCDATSNRTGSVLDQAAVSQITSLNPPETKSVIKDDLLLNKQVSWDKKQARHQPNPNPKPMENRSYNKSHNGNDDDNEDTSVKTVKKLRSELETRIDVQHDTQLDLLASLQTFVPNILSSVDLSLRILSSFSHKSFTPTPPLPKKKPLEIPKNVSKDAVSGNGNSRQETVQDAKSGNGGAGGDDSSDGDDGRGSPLSVVRVMVAECLLQRVPFEPIDSGAVLRKLESDQNATSAEKSALREVGGESGAILAVEMALRSMAEENRGVELEEFVVSGKSRVLVLSIDRSRLVKELPENAQHQRELELLNSSNLGNGGGTVNPNGADVNNSNNGVYGMGGAMVQWPTPGDAWTGREMWQGGMMMGPRGMMMGPRGLMQRPPLGPNNASLPMPGQQQQLQQQRPRTEEDDLKDLEALLNKKSYREMQKSKTGEELLDLIHRPTAKETAVAARFKTKGGSQVKEYCSALTKEDCRRQSGSFIACEKVHFRRIIAPHTDVSQGDCSFLDTCRHMKTCKYVHYELDQTPDVPPMGAGSLAPPKPLKPQRAEYCSEVELGEPQWINCDIRNFKMEILGQFGVIMADPPWDIHMELPYGTMADDEMRNLNVPVLQTDGLIFLWVTGRAMELGRECLELWGYKRVEEIIWVKTNQLQRIIRTGRTGHWLNHSKEHCLVGIKGNPEVNRNIDTDVIVAEVRETSRKPDEMYPMLERVSPRTRKLELFARMHNTQAGWMSLGNQLDGVRLVDEGLRARFKAAYPDVLVQPSSPPRASAMETDTNASQIRSPFTESKSSASQFAERTTPERAYAPEGKPMAADAEMAA